MIKRHFPEMIVSERIYIRKHELSWAPRMFDLVEADRERLRIFLPWVDFTATVEDEYAYLHQTQTQWDQFELYDYSIFRKRDEAYMGNIGLHNISWLGGTVELGYWIAGDYEGEGYITEASRALTSQAFKHGFHRVEIRCVENNQRSAGVPERLNFNLEARLRESTRHAGRYRDVLVYAMLEDDWAERAPPPR